MKYIGPQGKSEDRQPLSEAVAALHGGDYPIQPFHWQIEFPEVFTVDAKGKLTGGFDAMVGNPPLAGHVTFSEGNRDGYTEYLRSYFPESGGKCDVVAFFFRRAFAILRQQGCMGLIATNTIRQGDTRYSGLRWICTHSGRIYAARRRFRWPGQAAVVVSVIHIANGIIDCGATLDGVQQTEITAYLFTAGGHENPSRLSLNANQCFLGSVIRGQGFLFDDSDDSGETNSVALMQELIAKDPSNADVISPYIGVEDLLDNPTHASSRFVINFSDMEEDEARKWPDIFKIVTNKVLPQRKSSTAKSMSAQLIEKYWRFGHHAKELYSAIGHLDRVIATPQTSKFRAFGLINASAVFDKQLCVCTHGTYRVFAALSSQPHETWSLFFGSTLEDRPIYTLGDCFETFPFPAGLLKRAASDAPPTADRRPTALETAGRDYYEFRAALMVRNNEGLTKTYNRFHDPDERSPDILKLRDLHAAMDRAVLEAYGWHDLAQTVTCEFLLDYEEEEDEDEPTAGKKSKKKKPWRYRWPDDFRDEVLARLLALNAQRAEQERLTGKTAEAADNARKPRKTRRRESASPDQMKLID